MSGPPDEEVGLMFGCPSQDQPTTSELSDKIDGMELKLDRIKQDVTIVGIGVIILILIGIFKF